jgi:hypothetical protein
MDEVSAFTKSYQLSTHMHAKSTRESVVSPKVNNAKEHKTITDLCY